MIHLSPGVINPINHGSFFQWGVLWDQQSPVDMSSPCTRHAAIPGLREELCGDLFQHRALRAAEGRAVVPGLAAAATLATGGADPHGAGAAQQGKNGDVIRGKWMETVDLVHEFFFC